MNYRIFTRTNRYFSGSGAILAAALMATSGLISAQAATLYSLNSTVLDGSVGENTFITTPSGGSLVYTGGGSPTLQLNLVSSNYSVVAVNFGSTTLTNVGDSIKVTYAFSSAGSLINADSFRIGLFNYGTTSVSANVTSTRNDFAFRDDAGYTGVYRPTNPAAGNTLGYRTGAPLNSSYEDLFSSATRTTVAGSPTLSAIGTSSVTGSLSIELLAGGMLRLSSVVNGGTVQSVDTVATTTLFNELALFAGGAGVSPSITFSDLSVTYTSAVPEPSMAYLLGAGLIGVWMARMRRASRRQT